MDSVRWPVSKHQFSRFASLFLCVNCSSVHVVTVKLSTNNNGALFKWRFSAPWDERGFSLYIVTNMIKTSKNMLLNNLIQRSIHNVAEPILLTVLERQPKQQVGLSSIWQPWQKKLRKSGNDYVQSQRHVNQKRLKRCSIREPTLFQPNPVWVEMVNPNATRPICLI